MKGGVIIAVMLICASPSLSHVFCTIQDALLSIFSFSIILSDIIFTMVP